MSDSSKKSIPSWQRASPPQSESETQTPGAEESTPPTAITPDEKQESAQSQKSEEVLVGPQLVEQASKFLQDPTIRDAPRERKVAFLREKGVNEEDIQELLQNTKAEDASAEIAGDAAKAWSTPSASQKITAPPKDIPPIVTYPEFLTQPTSPPPLITINRILNTVYAAAGLGAITYGVSKFLVAPMTESLTTARHEFATNTQAQLDTLNEKLEGMVSTVPVPKPSKEDVAKEPNDDAVSEADSDPTELFHRDIGIQTSPEASRRPSFSTSGVNTPAPRGDPVSAQSARLDHLTTMLRNLSEAERSNATATDGVANQVTELKGYLNEMTYSAPYFSANSYTGQYGAWEKKNDDAIEGVKNDIRSVKGVLLSARNFPSGQFSAARAGR